MCNNKGCGSNENENENGCGCGSHDHEGGSGCSGGGCGGGQKKRLTLEEMDAGQLLLMKAKFEATIKRIDELLEKY